MRRESPAICVGAVQRASKLPAGAWGKWYTPAIRRYAAAVLLGLVIAGCGGQRGPVGVTGIDPSVGPTGGGTAVTINGWGFTAPVTVTIGGLAAGSVVLVNTNTITCTSPAHAAGYADVEVSSNGGADVVTRTNGFRYIVPPNVTSVAPNEGPSAGNTPVGISGSDFQSSIQVYFGGVPATNVVFNNSSFVTCVTPPGTGGQVDVRVVNPDTGEDTLTNGFTYRNPPAVASISPTVITSAGGSLDILGSNFYGTTSNTTVNIGGSPVTANSINTAQIQCTVPASTPGHYDVEVINPDGQPDELAGALLVYDSANTIFASETGSDTLGNGSLGNPYQSIGKGLSEADTQSKTLVVLAGTYSSATVGESFPISVPDAVTAYGEVGGTVADGGSTATAIFDLDTLASTTTLAGFSVTGASATSGTGIVAVDCTDAVLSDFTIDDCRLGIQVSGGALSVIGTTVSNNEYCGIFVSTGGGVAIGSSRISDNGHISSGTSRGGLTVFETGSSATVVETEFLRNTSKAITGNSGGGACIAAATGQFVRCTFRENTADYGGGVYVEDVDWDNDVDRNRQLFFTNCLFVDNESDSFVNSTGSSAYLYAWQDHLRGVEFTNCAFEGDLVPTTGGAVAVNIRESTSTPDYFAQPVFRNCVFNNSSGAALHATSISSAHSPPVFGVFALWYNGFKDNLCALSYNNVMTFNTEIGINDILTAPAGIPDATNVGNIVLQPTDTLFEGVGDYHLNAASRCIDAGDPDAAYNDFDTSRNDMGVYGGPDTW